MSRCARLCSLVSSRSGCGDDFTAAAIAAAAAAPAAAVVAAVAASAAAIAVAVTVAITVAVAVVARLLLSSPPRSPITMTPVSPASPYYYRQCDCHRIAAGVLSQRLRVESFMHDCGP